MFNLLNGSPVETLTKKSEAILDVFTKTTEQLKTINEEIGSERTKKTVELGKLQTELDSLNVIEKKNLGVIAKINKIFE